MGREREREREGEDWLLSIFLGVDFCLCISDNRGWKWGHCTKKNLSVSNAFCHDQVRVVSQLFYFGHSYLHHTTFFFIQHFFLDVSPPSYLYLLR